MLNKRDLPWRNTSDAYVIWLSETILQQTRISQGLAYYYRFLECFPSVNDLANAEIDEVLGIWQGLGYYSRARNMHETAKAIVNDWNSVFPQTFEELIRLKGVGRYTAAAISSFAFHKDHAVLDGNVIRVLSRLFEIGDDIRSQKSKTEFEKLANDLLPSGNSYLFNQGIMELGALICQPRNPQCSICPIREYCGAFLHSSQMKFPFKSASKGRRKRYLNYLLLECDGEIYFQKRSGKDIWEGLYEPILVEADRSFLTLENFLEAEQVVEILAAGSYQFKDWKGPVKHILSHQELCVVFCYVEISPKPALNEGKWVLIADIDRLPKPVIFSKLFKLETPTQLTLTF